MPMERLHIMVPKGTIKNAKAIAKALDLDTHSEYLRRVIMVKIVEDSIYVTSKKGRGK